MLLAKAKPSFGRSVPADNDSFLLDDGRKSDKESGNIIMLRRSFEEVELHFYGCLEL